MMKTVVSWSPNSVYKMPRKSPPQSTYESQWQTAYTRHTEREKASSRLKSCQRIDESTNHLNTDVFQCRRSPSRVCVLRESSSPGSGGCDQRVIGLNGEVSAAARVCLQRQLPGVCAALTGAAAGGKKKRARVICFCLPAWVNVELNKKKRKEKKKASSMFISDKASVVRGCSCCQWAFGLWRRACGGWQDTVICLGGLFFFFFFFFFFFTSLFYEELIQSKRIVRGRFVQWRCWLTSTWRSGARFSLLIAKETKKSVVVVCPGA